MNYFEEALKLHKKHKGKISVEAKMDIESKDDLATVYSPGVAEPCLEIEKNRENAYLYTIKGNTVAVVSDGSAVLGLGNIGAMASLPVMEGKAMLFKKFAGIDAFPIVLDTQDTDEIIETIRRIAPTFGGINLEDISSPRCFEIEDRLQDLGIPVFHDDQHGTAIVTLAGLINAAKLTGRELKDMKVVINGAGAAGIAIAKLLKCVGFEGTQCESVDEIIICDSKGIIHSRRDNLNWVKKESLSYSNKHDVEGDVYDAIKGADVFIGVSKGDLLTPVDIQSMAKDPIIFAMANPIPEIMPEEAYKGGAAVVGTGRSDLPNQVNNVLGFPGIFRGAIDARATRITPAMKLAAAYAIADQVGEPSRDFVIPSTLDEEVGKAVAKAVFEAARKEMLVA